MTNIKNSLLKLVLLAACAAPAFHSAAADELDSVLDDLINEREASRIASAQANASRGRMIDRSLASFPEISRFSSEKPVRSESGGVVQYSATYYPAQAGISYRVEFTYSLRRAGVGTFTKMKELALLLNRSARRDAATINGYHAAFIGSRGDRANGLILALEGGTYLTITAAAPANRETLSLFARHFTAQNLLRLKQSYDI